MMWEKIKIEGERIVYDGTTQCHKELMDRDLFTGVVNDELHLLEMFGLDCYKDWGPIREGFIIVLVADKVIIMR